MDAVILVISIVAFLIFAVFMNHSSQLSGRGDIGLLISAVPKVLLLRFLIRRLKNLRYFHGILIGWFIKLRVPTVTISFYLQMR